MEALAGDNDELSFGDRCYEQEDLLDATIAGVDPDIAGVDNGDP